MKRRLERRTAEALLKAVATLLKAQSLYPAGHTAIQKAVRSAARQLESVHGTGQPVLIGSSDGYLVVGDVPFLDGAPHAELLRQRFESQQIEGVVLKTAVGASELARFCEWLRGSAGQPWRGRDIVLTRVEKDLSPLERAERSYGQALEALEEAYQELEEGRLPSPERARECVQTFAHLVEETPSVLRGLVLIKDYDRYTFHHSVNVCLLALGLGRHLGCSPAEQEVLGVSGLFHDIGKTRTPAELVRKPGQLSSQEWSEMLRHPLSGRELLEEMAEIAEPVPRVVYEHHMRFDGGGYPERPAGYSPNPLSALITVVDSYDAMTTHRPYQAPTSLPEAVGTVARLRGKQFSPRAADAFVAMMGAVPAGSAVRLASGEVAVVIAPELEGAPARARVVITATGHRLAPEQGPEREISSAEVAGWADPLAHNINPFEVLKTRG